MLANGVMVALAATLLSSCSSGGGASTSSGGSTPIPLGVIGSFSGSQSASTALAKPAIQAWADSVNASGGLGGHKINLIVMDDAGVASTAVSDVRELVQQDHVSAILNDWSSASDQFGSYLQQQGVPLVGGYEQLAADPLFFPAGTTDTPLLTAAYAVALKKGATKMSLAYCAEVAVCSDQIAASQAAANTVGSKLVWTGKFLADAPSYTAPCLSAKASGANGMFVSDSSAAVIKFVTACAQQGFNPIQVTLDATITDAWLTVPALNGTIATEEDAPWFLDNTPALKAFHDAMNKYEPGRPINSASIQAWAAGLLYVAAYKAAGSPASPTKADILTGLFSLKNETLDGISPPLNYVKGQPTAVKCAFVVGIENGKFTAPQGLKTTCVS